MAPPPAPTCPCDSGHTLPACCGRWLQGPAQGQAPDALALMRSRYTATVQRDEAYLLATWHPATRPAQLAPSPAGLRWLGLEIRRHAAQDDRHAVVEFVARFKQGGRAQRLHETSRFVLEAGRWYYVDGDLHTPLP